MYSAVNSGLERGDCLANRSPSISDEVSPIRPSPVCCWPGYPRRNAGSPRPVLPASTASRQNLPTRLGGTEDLLVTTITICLYLIAGEEVRLIHLAMSYKDAKRNITLLGAKKYRYIYIYKISDILNSITSDVCQHVHCLTG